MSWIVLILSGLLEAVWATALSASRGFTRRRATLVFAVSMLASMAGLAWAMRSIPTGTAYAVWVGIGATLTVTWSIATRQERPTTARLVLLGMLVASIVGLKVVS